MKAINKVVAYSSSSLILFLLICCAMDFKILGNGYVWTIALTLALPIGLCLEVLYSRFYFWLRLLLDKIPLTKKAIGLYTKKNLLTSEEEAELRQSFFILYNNESYQTMLSENNIIRNMWISALIGLIFSIFYYFFGSKISIDELRLFIWLPISILIAWAANFRTECLIKKVKYYAFREYKKSEIKGDVIKHE
jgi:hypothetical protein